MKLTIKDIITIGIYSLLYFIFVAIGTFLGVIIIRSANMLLAPIFAALLCGVVYMLLIEKTQKFTAITIVGTVMGLFFFATGHYFLSFLPSFIFAIIADLIAKIGNYKSKITNLISYIVFSFGNLGPIILMWVAKEAYIQRLIEKNKDAQYIKNVMVDFTFINVGGIAIALIIAGLIGGLFGQYLVKKHFSKAGLSL